MEWSSLVVLNVALVVVPTLVGVWAWWEVTERVRAERGDPAPTTRVMRLALIVASVAFLFAAGLWAHPATIHFVAGTLSAGRLALYALLALPWTAFGTIGLLARTTPAEGGRRGG